MPVAHNLTREIAQNRSRTVTLSDQQVHLDLTRAADAVATFTSTSIIRITSSEPRVQIDLVADAAPKVLLDGVEIEAGFADSLVTIDGLTPGHEHVITIVAECAYSHTGEGLHRFRDPQDGETYLYTHFEPTDARRVFACFDQPDLKTRFAVSVTAPTGWLVRSNGAPTAQTPATQTPAERTTLHEFTPTMPQSTYILCVVAGPYHLVEDEATMPDGRTVPLAVMCRPAMKDALPAADVLRWTKAGLPWCEDKFGVSYPWGTYDQIFVPEYNIGAMENPGLVTFNENYLKRGEATRSEREGLATTLLHEMAHMWFGDLVTMPWWDDLWLKESFADFIGTQAAAEVTEFTDAWATFGLGRKAWAYQADQLPTTHPIVADIPDVEAARANFDGITYAKGASVLRQLVAYAGEEAFYRGTTLYFERHAFTNATLDDFLDALSEASGRDMSAWAQAWLMTSGPDTLSLGDGAIVRDGERPHRIHVAGFDLDDTGAWRAGTEAWIDLSEATTPLPETLGGALVLIDDEDWTYAKVAPSEEVLDTFGGHLAALPSATQRAAVWGQMWQACRDARLPADAYLRAVLTQLVPEASATIVDGVARSAIVAVTSFLPPGERCAWSDALWATSIERASGAEDADVRGVWRRVALMAAGSAPGAGTALRAMLDAAEGDDEENGDAQIDGRSAPFAPDQDERWAILVALAATAGPHESSDVRDRLAAEAQRDSTKRGAAQHLCATAAFADDDAKRAAWQRTGDESLTNEEVGALVSGFTHPASESGAQRYAAEYLANLEGWWHTRSQVIASRLVRGLFGTQPSPDAATQWLTDHPHAPAALRRIVIEEIDQLQRRLRAQSVSGR